MLETKTLTQMRTLIDAAGVKLELSEHESGNYLLRSTLKQPQAVAFYQTTDALLGRFVAGVITLQQLFDATPSLFIEVVDHTGTRLLLKHDVDLLLRFGNKTFDWFCTYNTL